ncbi:MAG: hypothetical protein IT322_03045, partial [Anaerolineae bacterium]|nr:hypothetical protein [Anaerolineae bacterium]
MSRPTTRRYAFTLLALLTGLLLSLHFLPVQSQENPNNIIIPAGDSQALVAAIQRANQTPATPVNIYLQAGQYLLYGPNEGGKPSLPLITGTVTVFGQNTLILLQSEAATPAQIEIAPGASAEFHHLHLLLASGTGRSVVNRGTVRIYDSTFGSLDREVLPGVGEGGGIENYGSLSIERTTFARNQYLSTNTEGGAIYNAGSLTVSCTRFVEGLASRGGAIFNTGSATIFSSAFEENIANGGGAIFSAEGAVDASGNWWRGSEPAVNDLYLGRDTISAGVNADSPLASDPTAERGCQAQPPLTNPEALGTTGTAPTLTNTTTTDTPSGILPHDPDLGPIIRVSVASDGTQGKPFGDANGGSISADGRFVAFAASYNNLVPNDTNNTGDVFLHDCQTGETIRVSVSSSGVQANNHSYASHISRDGQFIGFISWATNLVAGDTNGVEDVFVYDRITAQVERVSVSSTGVQGDGISWGAAFSGDGRFVVFNSDASNLVSGDTNGYRDVFVRDRLTSETTRISLSTAGEEANGNSVSISITTDGNLILFNSDASNLVEGDTNGVTDAFLHNRLTGQTVRVSLAWDGSEANGATYGGWVSNDGQAVVLDSEASNLIPGDTNNESDVFFRYLVTGAVTRVSVDSEGNQAEGSSGSGRASDDGRFISFSSTADNLTLYDDALFDVFVHDRVTGLTILVSTAADGTPGNDDSFVHGITSNGDYLAILSYATNLVPNDTNNGYDIFRVPVKFTPSIVTPLSPSGTITSPTPTLIWQREPKSTMYKVLVHMTGGTFVYAQIHSALNVCDATTCSITPPLNLLSGNYTFYVIGINNAGEGALDSRSVLAFTVIDPTDTFTRVSVASDGTQGNAASGFAKHAISADGRYVVFSSEANNLVPNDTNGVQDVFLRDRQTGITSRVSVASDGTQANGRSDIWRVSISADGRYIVFQSEATNLVPNDTNNRLDVFVRDQVNGTTSRVSLASDGTQGNGESRYGVISADGRYVVFASQATNLVLGDTNNFLDSFIHDRVTGITERISIASDGSQAMPTGGTLETTPHAEISDDGRYVVFSSPGSGLVPGDTNSKYDVFVRDRLNNTTVCVSLTPVGQFGVGSSEVMYPSISSDGGYITFFSAANDLVAGDTNGVSDVFGHDRVTGETTRLSLAPDGTQGNGASGITSISDDNRYVAFESNASNLVVGDTNSKWDIFVLDRTTGQIVRFSQSVTGMQGNNHSYAPQVSSDGQWMSFYSEASNLVPNDTNSAGDTFVALVNFVPNRVIPISPSGYSPPPPPLYRFVWYQEAKSSQYEVKVVRADSTVVYSGIHDVETVCGSTCEIMPDLVLEDAFYTWSVRGISMYGAGPWSSMDFQVSIYAITPTIGVTPRQTPSSTFTPSLTHTPSPTRTPSLTLTRTVTRTPSLTLTRSLTPSLTNTRTPAPSLTRSLTRTLTPSRTPSRTPTPTWTLTPSMVPTNTRTPTPSWTPTVTPAFPGTIVQVSPSGNITSRTPTFTWQKEANSTSYDIQIVRNDVIVIHTQNYTSVAVCGPSTCSITPALDLSSDYYSWWVRGINGSGNGPWSGQGFAMTILPGLVTQTAPIGAYNGRSPTFTWNRERDSHEYGIWIGQGSTTLHLAYIQASTYCNSTTCSYTPPLDLSSDYYVWWVGGYSLGGGGDWTGTGFHVTVLPGLVTQTAPIGAYNGRTPTFTWERDRDSHEYGIWIGQGGTTLHLAYIQASTYCNSTTCSYTPALDLSSDYYTWWVGGYSLGGGGPWNGNGFHVTVTPAAVIQLGPQGTINQSNPSFTWQRNRDAFEYGIWIGQGSTPLHQTTLQANTVCPSQT